MRMSRSPFSSRSVLLAVVVAVVGASAGYVQASSTASARTGRIASNCTQYAPITTQCATAGTMYSNGTYATPSYAYRDDNIIALAGSRTWTLELFDNPSGLYFPYYGSGTGGVQPGNGGHQLKAGCYLDFNQPSVFGECYTDWH
jgi:hypothetical protein